MKPKIKVKWRILRDSERIKQTDQFDFIKLKLQEKGWGTCWSKSEIGEKAGNVRKMFGNAIRIRRKVGM